MNRSMRTYVNFGGYPSSKSTPWSQIQCELLQILNLQLKIETHRGCPYLTVSALLKAH